MDSALMTIEEAAKELGIEPGTLRMQVSKGKITPIRVGTGPKGHSGLLLIHRDELERYRRERSGKPGRKPKATP
jgi:excisionase family DNA binding protein